MGHHKVARQRRGRVSTPYSRFERLTNESPRLCRGWLLNVVARCLCAPCENAGALRAPQAAFAQSFQKDLNRCWSATIILTGRVASQRNVTAIVVAVLLGSAPYCGLGRDGRGQCSRRRGHCRRRNHAKHQLHCAVPAPRLDASLQSPELCGTEVEFREHCLQASQKIFGCGTRINL